MDTIKCEQQWTQRCVAPDIASLFVEWLNELLYQREIYGALFGRAYVARLEQAGREWILEGIACGEALDLHRHIIHTEVKAATYSGLDYYREQDLYIVQCVVDL